MLSKNKKLDFTLLDDCFMVKNCGTGKYVKLGSRETRFLYDLIGEEVIPVPAGEEMPSLRPEEKRFLQSRFEQFGFIGKSADVRREKRNVFDCSIVSFGNSRICKKWIGFWAGFISKGGLALLFLSLVAMLSMVKLFYPVYLRAVTTVVTETRWSAVIAMYLIYLISGIFHETGHLAACWKFTGMYGRFGLKLYFGFPAFYSDVSDIYRSSKRMHGIVTSLAGVLMNLELFFLSLCLIPAFAKAERFMSCLLMFGAFNLGSFIVNLIPFAKFDGYWLIRNISGINYLYDKSVSLAMLFLLRHGSYSMLQEKKKSLLALYGAACLAYSVCLWYLFARAVMTYLELLKLSDTGMQIGRILLWIVVLAGEGSFCVRYYSKARNYIGENAAY